MNIFSIRSRLIFWIGSVVTLILAAGSYFIYQTASSNSYREIDKNLVSIMELEALELEIVDGRVIHEWLSDIENDDLRVQSAYIQTWDETTGETKRSPALKGLDLPHFSDFVGLHFSNILLPNGHHGRVIAKSIFPVVEWVDQSLVPATPVESMPFYMAIAVDVEASHDALKRLVGVLLLGLVFSLLVSIVTIRLIIMSSFRSLVQLEQVIRRIDVNNPKDVFEIPRNLPLEVSGLVTQYRDLFFRISRVRERERDFSTNVAHELRTPLAGLEATLEQALVTEREAADYRQRIIEALQIASSMGELVNRLMWFSRLQNRSELVEQGDVDLAQIVVTRLAILSDEISERGLDVQAELAEDLPTLHSDETLLGILVNNVIGNAVAHSDPGTEVLITLSQALGQICCVVSNNCADFDAAELPRLYDAFYRADSARSGNVRHSGIGLSLAREITKLLQLEIDLSYAAPVFTVKVLFPEK
jgi:signal transduction histidine kinase